MKIKIKFRDNRLAIDWLQLHRPVAYKNVRQGLRKSGWKLRSTRVIGKETEQVWQRP